VVPLNTPDNVADPTVFFAGANAKDAYAAQMSFELTAQTAGRNEVRLYSIPSLGTGYSVAARAAIAVTTK
jgi:hypothetical protein